MSCQYKRSDGLPCRCGEIAIKDGVVIGHYDCVGPPGVMCPPDGGLPLQCRICKTPCGDGVHDHGRCASCYNMGIVGFNAGRVITETPINDFIVDLVSVLGEQRFLELTKWVYDLMSASAASELEARK